MSATVLERSSTSEADDANIEAELSEMTRFMAHVVGKDGLHGYMEDADRLAGRVRMRRLVSAAPPNAKPRPSNEDTDEFLMRLDLELWANAEAIGDIIFDTELAVAVHGGKLATELQTQLTPVQT